MTQLSLHGTRLIPGPNAPFGRPGAGNLGTRLGELKRAERAARDVAAATATQKSRDTFHYLREPIQGLRRNKRFSTGGRFGSHITWAPSASGVALDINELDSKAEQWVILEIGTGHTARMRFGGDETENSGARPVELKTVKSQRGRRIHGSLVFGTGIGGQYSPPGFSRTQQMFFRDQVTGAPSRRREIRIRNEIKGQHFIQQGAKEGFRQYRNEVLAAARKQFRKAGP